MPIPIPLGGLSGLDADELATIDQPINCDDCVTDDNTISGRAGYRAAIAGTLGSTSVQHAGRYRPSPSFSRVVDVVGGAINTITDPSSESASDGAGTSAGTPFASSANISGAQLNKDYYIGTDEAAVAMRRLKFTAPSTMTLETLEALRQGNALTLTAFSSLAWTVFSGITPTVSGCVLQTTANTGFASMAASWRGFAKTNNGNDDPTTGASAQYKLAADFDATSYDWLAIAVSPHDSTLGPNYQVTIALAYDVAGSPGTFNNVGVIYDVPPIGGSPNLIYLYLRDLDTVVKSAVRYIRFTVDGLNGGKFITYGYMFLPSRSKTNPELYYATCQNPATGQESPATAGLTVLVRDSDVVLPSYPNSYMTSNQPTNNGANEMLSNANIRIFNSQVSPPIPLPALSDIGAVKTLNIPLDASWIAGYVVRLWKDTPNGRRLVNTRTLTGGDVAATTIALTDNGGIGTLANELYKPGGAPPRTNAVAARGGRLVCAYENRLYVSSFVPPDANNSPFPQFPAIPLIEADGYAFDIAPANDEQILSLVNGDSLYIGTNKCVRSMYDMTAAINGRVPDIGLVFQHPVVSRNGALYCEEGYCFASTDGVYLSHNRVGAAELSRPIRKKYKSWFLPDNTVTIAYQFRKLYVTRGNKQLRFDFVKQRWSRHTLGHTIQQVAWWVDPGSALEQLWLFTSDFKIGRLQAGYATDLSTAIPDWVYSTGYERLSGPGTVKSVMLDLTNNVTATLCKDASNTGANTRRVAFNTPQIGSENEQPGSANLRGYKMRMQITAANSTVVRYMEWDYAALPGAPTGG